MYDLVHGVGIVVRTGALAEGHPGLDAVPDDRMGALQPRSCALLCSVAVIAVAGLAVQVGRRGEAVQANVCSNILVDKSDVRAVHSTDAASELKGK